MKENSAGINKNGESLAMTTVWQLVVAVCGFLMSRTTLFGEFAPFGIALAAGVPNSLAPAAAIGAGLGYFLPVTEGSGFRYMAAVVCVAMIKFLLIGRIKFKSAPLFSALTAFVTGIVTSAAVLVSTKADSILLLTLAVESLASASIAYFVAVVCGMSESARGLRGLSTAETVSAVVVIGVLLMSLKPIAVGGISVASIISVMLILSASRCGHAAAGVISGAALGFALSLAGGTPMWLSGAYAMAGLIAGVFSASGSIGCAVILNAVIAIFVIIGGVKDNFYILAESLSASVLFFILPSKFRLMLSALFTPEPEMPRLDGLRKAVTMRLQFASEALSDISATVETVASRLGELNEPSFEQMLYQVEEDVCSACKLRKYCWQDNLDQTVSTFTQLTKTEITPSAVEGDVGKLCSRLESVCESLKTRYSQFTGHKAAQRRVDEIRSVLIDQFAGVSDMLYDMACEFESARRYDIEAAQRVETALRGVGIIPTDIGCCIDSCDRMTVEIRVQTGGHTRLNRMTLKNEISLACDRDFDAPSISSARNGALITLSEHAEVAVDTGCFSLPMNDAKLCGDATEIFVDGKGRQLMLLCDGMGTGGRAAVDGAMAAGLMQRLLMAGFGYDCALKIANSAMLFKSTDESLSTVDLCSIDLFTGRTELYKAGACPTIILRSGRTAKAECTSLPAGIVRQVGFDSAAVMLKAGDIIVMFSDGVTADGTDWICAEVEAWRSSGTAQQLAEHLARAARRRRSDGHADDITVMAAIIEKAVK